MIDDERTSIIEPAAMPAATPPLGTGDGSSTPRRARRSRPPEAGEATTAPPRRRTTRIPKDVVTAEAGAAPHPTPRPRRASGRPHSRESGVQGLGERARLVTPQPALGFLPDPLAMALPGMRQSLLNAPLEDGLRVVAEGLAASLAPALARVWITDPAPWAGEHLRIGGQQIAPAVRLRAEAQRAIRPSYLEAVEGAENLPTHPLAPIDASSPLDTTVNQASWSATPDPLLAEVVAARRPIVLPLPGEHPLAERWQTLLPAGTAAQPAAALGTLAAYPLLARGRLLGVLAVGTTMRLNARQLATVAELADLAALAADRDQLLRYSRSQEALAQTVVRHAPVAMAVLTGPEHVCELANPTFALLLGVGGEMDLYGRRLGEVIPERAESFIAGLGLRAVLATGEPQAMIELPIHQERGLTYWNVTTSPLPSLGEHEAGVLIAAVEVTRQVLTKQRAQDAAEVAQERIGQMMTLHATSLAVASQLGADPRELLGDILRRSILLLNARAGTVYARGPRHDELRVIVCQGLRGDYTGNRIRIGEGLAGQVALSGHGLIVDDYRAYPYRAAIYDNEVFSAVIAVPLVHHGQVIGVLDVLDDAERRTFTDDDLWLLDLFASQAAQAMENARTFVELERAYRKQRELDRLKDDFIATASHELRTPLTGVQGFLDLLLDYSGSRDEPLALDFLQKATDSAQELADISDRLLQTSRLDTGRIEMHLTPVRLAPVVGEVLRAFRELRAAHGTTHELLAEVPPEINVRADLGRLKEVLDNLVSNAVKYSPHGGRVTVRCVPAALGAPEAPGEAPGEAPDLPGGAGQAPVEDRPTIVLAAHEHDTPSDATDRPEDALRPASAVVAAASVEPYFVLLVSDEGMGIAAEERHRLFGRFSRTDSARASQIRGTGLGLYICRQILRAMGGDIWLHESALGHGSTFAVALPGALVPADAPSGPPPNPYHSHVG